MKKYLLLLALVCLLGNRALAQTKSSFSQSITEVMDFSGYSVDWQGSDIKWVGNSDKYVAGVTENGQTRSFASKLDNLYYLSVGEGNTGKWQIGQVGYDNNNPTNHPENSYMQCKQANTKLYIHNIKIGDKVKIWLDGSCEITPNNIKNYQNNNGCLEFEIADNTVNDGNVTLNFPNQYDGVKRIEIQTTKSHFNYDPGYEVYDFFEIGGRNSNAYDNNYSANNDAGFTLNDQDAKYLSLAQSSGLSLNNRIAVSQSSGWTFRRGIRSPNYNNDGNNWHNVSICNLREGDRVEIFYTGDAPTFSSQGQNGKYTGSAGFKDVKNDGQYNPEEGDQMVYVGMLLEGISSRNEGNLSREEGTTVLLYHSFAYVMTEDGHLDLGLKNGNHTRILKVKIYSDHQATMIDENVNKNTTRAFFDITGELQAKEHIVPGGLEVRVGNNEPDQHAIVVTSKRGPVSYVNAEGGYKIPGVTKENGVMVPNYQLDTNVPETGTFYKFIALRDGTMKVRFNASSMNYYRYDLAGNAIFYNDDQIVKNDEYGGWLAEFDRANEWTLGVTCPYYVKVTEDGTTYQEAKALWDGGSSSGSGGGGGNNGDITLTTPSMSQTLSISEILNNTSNTNDIVTFYFNITNYYSGLDIGYLESSNNNTQYRFNTSNVTGNGDFQLTYTVQELINIAGSQNGGIKANVYNATLSRVALASSSSSGSGSSSTDPTDPYANGTGSKSYGNGHDGEFVIHVEAGKTYYFYGGWEGTGAIGLDPNNPNMAACGVAELLDVTFTADKYIYPLAKWVPNATKSDDDLADVIGYDDDALTVKKVSGNIDSCTPYIQDDKLMIKDIKFIDETQNCGGVILIKVGDPDNIDDPVYAFTIAYDASYNSTPNVEESQRGHTWDFSTNSLRGLKWESPYEENGAVPTDFGTYYQDYFGKNLTVNSGSLLSQEMEYYVDDERRSDWMFNYRLQIGDDGYDPRFLNKYDIEGDNADMMWDTEGLIFQASSNQSCMFNEYKSSLEHNAIDRNGNNLDKDPDRYIGILPGGKFIIPHLDKDDRVIIYMGSGVGNGFERMVFNITNARDAEYKVIDSKDDYIAGGSQWNGANGDPYYRGCYHFFAQANGDMIFELASGSMCKIYKIQIYHGDRINTNEIKGATENDKFLLWSRAADPNDTNDNAYTEENRPNWTLKYFNKDQKLADGTNSVENDIISQTGNLTKAITTNTTANTFTYEHSLGEIGTFRMRGKDMEKNMKYVADYADRNVTVAYQQTQTYPYTWDFMDVTGFSGTALLKEDQLEAQKPTGFTDTYWNSIKDTYYEITSNDLSLWEIDNANGGYYLRLNSQTGQTAKNPKEKDNIFETAKDIDGNQVWANGAVIPETKGLWFYTNDNNQGNGTWVTHNDGMQFNYNGGTLVVPNVPAGAAVYLRTEKTVTSGNVFTMQFKDGTSNSETYGPVAAYDNAYEYIYAIKNTASTKRHLVLNLYGYQLKKLAVSKDPKAVNTKGWTSESRDHAIDAALTPYLTGKPIKTYFAGQPNHENRTLVLTDISNSANNHVMPAETGCVLFNEAAKDYQDDINYNAGKVEIFNGGFHLFVPDMHDGDKLAAPTDDINMLRPQLIEVKPLPEGDDTNTYYVLSYSYYNLDAGGNPKSNTAIAGPEKFYRVAKTKIGLRANSAYLALPTSEVKPKNRGTVEAPAKCYSFVFADYDDFFASNLNGIATEIEGVETVTPQTVQEGWYTINGQKLSGRPTTSGLYIVNGKKVLVK